MATATTNNFNLDLGDLIEEAFERAGVELRTGYEYRTARRSLDLMMLEWQNRGLNLWTIEGPTEATVTAGTATYSLDADTVDLLEHHLRLNDNSVSSQTDYNLRRISTTSYSDIPNKLSEGRPLQIYIERGVSTFQYTFWPVPDDVETYTFVYFRMRQIYDSGTPASNNMDVPKLFLPALASGLAFYVAMKQPEAANRLPMLQAEYERQWELAAEENRVKAPFRFVPFQSYI
tara:strand:+ start:520 stop:1215 length:696 start_codon:yes stop_codon:yes gene_type:complete